MKTDCTEYRNLLRARFDAGSDIGTGPAAHGDACRDCKAFREHLMALSNAFSAMPLERPRNALAARVISRLAAEPPYRNDARWWLPAAAALTGVLFIGIAGYYAVPIDPWMWWHFANGPGVTPEWLLRDTTLAEDFAVLQHYWSQYSSTLRIFSSQVLWALAAASAILLAGINGVEAYRLRSASNDILDKRHWR